MAGVVNGHTERLEYLDLWIRRRCLLRAGRGLQVVRGGAAGQWRVAVAVVGCGGGCGAAHGAGRREAGGGAGVAVGSDLLGVGPALRVVVVLVAPGYLGAGVLGAALGVGGGGGRGLGNGVGGHLSGGAQGCCEV